MNHDIPMKTATNPTSLQALFIRAVRKLSLQFTDSRISKLYNPTVCSAMEGDAIHLKMECTAKDAVELSKRKAEFLLAIKFCMDYEAKEVDINVVDYAPAYILSFILSF